LSFLLPIVFFSIFAMVFGGRRDMTPKITVIVADQDHSRASGRLIKGLEAEASLVVKIRPAPKKGEPQPEYTAETAETAVTARTPFHSEAAPTLQPFNCLKTAATWWPRRCSPACFRKSP